MNITATIITLNEEENIEACIRSAQQVCDEVIVVDSQSSDNTVSIAKSLGAKVYIQPYLGDGPQKDFGVQFAKNNWILSLDADERVHTDMADDIEKIDLNNATEDAFSFRRKSYIGDRWQKLWYPDNIVRLYHKDRCRYSQVKGHAQVEAKNVKRFKSHIIHYSYKDLSDMAKKIDKFSYRGAKMLFEKGKKAYFFTPVLRGLSAFLKKYILKGGIFMGVDGFTVSLFSGFNTYLKYAMLLEMYQSTKKTI